MRTFKLQAKPTLLSSVIIVAMLVAALVITSAAIANIERTDDQTVAEIQARDLAQHITDMRSHDRETLTRAAALIKGSRPNITAVRIWELSNGEFSEEAAAFGSAPATPIPENTKNTLRAGAVPKIVSATPSTANDSLYRVFAVTSENGRPAGAVEIVQRFDSIWTVALRYLKNVIWLSVIAIILVLLGTYFLFRQLQLTTKLETEKGILRERVRDATVELRKRNQLLQETNLELWHTNRRMNELGRLAAAGQTAAHFAHEVGTPLNLISGHVQLLKSELDRDPRDAEARIKTISAQIERIERIVRRMLDKTRFETELSPLDLNVVLRKLCDAMAPTFDKHNICLAKAFADKLPLMAGSSDRLQQLFLNLINNSLDAMSAGGEIQIRTVLEGRPGKAQRIVVDFIDSGSGMTAEVMSHIFDPLYTTKDRGRGTGLGLVIVKQVVSELGGTVTVESELGKGTHFRISFPAIPNDAPITVEDQEREVEVGI
ncbi:MAG TPA: HAMP domain-containing sensor histidine kinase [Pyrinomonadaceae bacterium]|nr:HAMP domain-containing sensor histidine kinase [Pyrinomonadaceae bacterium]